MISKILCKSRKDTMLLREKILQNDFKSEGFDNVFCISINGTAGAEGIIDGSSLFTFVEILTSFCDSDPSIKKCTRIHSFKFDDISPESVVKYPHLKSKFMSDTQARDIITLLRRWNAISGNNLLIVHCQAGICRSGSIVKFAGCMFELEHEVIEWNPFILGNNWVTSLLFSEYYKIQEMEEE